MKIAIGADHGGVHLKTIIAEFLKSLGHEVHDLGTFTNEPVDYPDYSRAVSQEILFKKAERGILVCGSGVGPVSQQTSFPHKGCHLPRHLLCHQGWSTTTSTSSVWAQG